MIEFKLVISPECDIQVKFPQGYALLKIVEEKFPLHKMEDIVLPKQTWEIYDSWGISGEKLEKGLSLEEVEKYGIQSLYRNSFTAIVYFNFDKNAYSFSSKYFDTELEAKENKDGKLEIYFETKFNFGLFIDDYRNEILSKVEDNMIYIHEEVEKEPNWIDKILSVLDNLRNKLIEN